MNRLRYNLSVSTKVSVIIPTYNEEKHIGECLESLLKQTHRDMEIIVVDDGSSDRTRDIISSPITLLRQKHLGPGAARNLGAKEAKGEILVFVDADMTFDKSFIKKLVDPIVKGKVKGTFSKEEYVSNWENVWARCWSINEGWMEKRRHPKDYPNKQKVFRAILKSEFDQVNGFDPSRGYVDDWSLGERLGYDAINALGAKFYHKNPDTLGEVFKQAKWVGKRKYKFGIFGSFIALLRASLPVSIAMGIAKSIVNTILAFLVFKIVYDLGLFVGIIEFLITGKGAK